MDVVKSILNFLLIKDTTEAITAPEGFCPNCWGREEYGGQFYERVKQENLNAHTKDSNVGWVQSYGSRCVKPPILFGDVSRTSPMTTKWTRYAQSLTDKPVKGMLTGPVTILQWSFVRDDLARSETCKQIALITRDLYARGIFGYIFTWA